MRHFGEGPAVDRVVERLLVALARLADQGLGLGVGVVRVALHGLEVELDPEPLAVAFQNE
jgi:hypothetical protein